MKGYGFATHHNSNIDLTGNAPQDLYVILVTPPKKWTDEERELIIHQLTERRIRAIIDGEDDTVTVEDVDHLLIILPSADSERVSALNSVALWARKPVSHAIGTSLRRLDEDLGLR